VPANYIPCPTNFIHVKFVQNMRLEDYVAKTFVLVSWYIKIFASQLPFNQKTETWVTSLRHGRAMAQAFSRRSLTVEERIKAPA
jgi:hypothetical protein